jgi:predicted ribosome quality control (RQC) complex YloA/Tae2 family protein
MLSNYHTLALIADDLNRQLMGKTVGSVFSQTKDELIVTFPDVPFTLVVCCRPETNAIYFHPSYSRARNNSADVLKELPGTTVSRVGVVRGERIVFMHLANRHSIQVRLFGARANVFLLNELAEVADAFKGRKNLIGTPLLAVNRENVYDVTSFHRLWEETPAVTISAAIKGFFPSLGATLVREILHRASVSERSTVGGLDASVRGAVEASFSMVLVELSNPAPRVYVRKSGGWREPHRFSLIRLEHCSDLEEKPFPSVHDAVRYFVTRTISSKALLSEARALVGSLTQQLGKVSRAMTALQEDLQQASRSEMYERYGAALMVNLNRFSKGMTRVTVADEAGDLTIPVDPKLAPVQNAQRYFERAKKARVADEESRARLHELQLRMNTGEHLIALAKRPASGDAWREFLTANQHDLDLFGLGEKSKEREGLPFRIFTVDGGFMVWAGKSSSNNDLLTTKYAKPDDLWFHARGAGGSHVVLKISSGKGEPGKRARAQAAAIAAYYSKMKNARTVPVAMTERKYVRKPKGAPPGTVVIERETVIFAEPALPDTNKR